MMVRISSALILTILTGFACFAQEQANYVRSSGPSAAPLPGTQVPLSTGTSRRGWPLRLSGVFQSGYTNSQTAGRFAGGFGPDLLTHDQAHDVFWGLDIIARSYILDPRFINFSLEPNFLRSHGTQDSTDNHRAATGGNFYLELLPELYYPFRFHFNQQDADYVQSHLNSSNTATRSIGFDWTLRRPKLPRVLVNYDSNTYNYELSAVPTSLSHTKTFSVLSSGNLDGWANTLDYNKNTGTEAFTGVESSTSMLRGDTRKELFSHSVFMANGLYQSLRFTTTPGAQVSLPFLTFNSNFTTRHTKKLSTNAYYRYSWMGNVSNAEGNGQPSGIAPTNGQPEGVAPTAPLLQPRIASAFMQSAGGGVNYLLFQGLGVGESVDSTFTSTLDPNVEQANRQISAIGNVNFQRSIRQWLQTRAGYDRGLAWATTNLGNSRPIWFDSYRTGLEFGDRKYLLAQADYSVSNKPELFEIGGRYSERRLAGSLESRILRGFVLRGSVGRDRLDFLSSRGRERFNTFTYSASIENRRLSLVASRNSGVGLQPLLFSPLEFEPSRLFRILPVASLLATPLTATFTVTSTASAEMRLRARLNAQFRYVRERIMFPSVSAVLINRYEVFADYHLGKFVFTAGVMFNMDETQGISQRDRRYYFFKLARSFRIF